MRKVQRHHGFSLIEMLIVLAIVAMVAAVSMPYARQSGERRELDMAVIRIAAQLRMAQMAAQAKQSEQWVAVDTKARRVTSSASPDKIELPATVTIEVTAALDGIRNDTGEIRFFPDGGSTGGKLRFQQGQYTRGLAVNWLTGAVTTETEGAQ